MIFRVGEKGLGAHVHAQRRFPFPSLNGVLLHNFVANEEEEENTHDASWEKESMIGEMFFLSSLLGISLLFLLPDLPVLFPLLVPHRATPNSSSQKKKEEKMISRIRTQHKTRIQRKEKLIIKKNEICYLLV